MSNLLASALKRAYPDARPAPFGQDYCVHDDGDGPYLKTWDAAKLGPRPSEQELAALAAAFVEPLARRLIAKSMIVDRLQEVQKLAAARAALDAADLYTRERWNTRDAIYSDDETAIALLTAIGADPAVILAP